MEIKSESHSREVLHLLLCHLCLCAFLGPYRCLASVTLMVSGSYIIWGQGWLKLCISNGHHKQTHMLM